MRKDENDEPCPETLGEYRDLCAAINPDSEAVAFLDFKIAESSRGRDEVIISPDSQMRMILMPMLVLAPSGKYSVTSIANQEE